MNDHPASTGVADWVIRRRGYFYRPGRAGYTASIAEAGRYTQAEAETEAASVEGVTAHPARQFIDDGETLAGRLTCFAGIDPRLNDHARALLNEAAAFIRAAGGQPREPAEPAHQKWPGEPPHCPSCACGVAPETADGYLVHAARLFHEAYCPNCPDHNCALGNALAEHARRHQPSTSAEGRSS